METSGICIYIIIRLKKLTLVVLQENMVYYNICARQKNGQCLDW